MIEVDYLSQILTGGFFSGCFYHSVYMYVCVRVFIHMSDTLLLFESGNQINDWRFKAFWLSTSEVRPCPYNLDVNTACCPLV